MNSDDERAVSVALTHALTFGITAILVTALLASAGAFLESQEEAVGQNQLNDVGSDVVSHVNSLDRLDNGESTNLTVSPSYPATVVGESYTVQFTDEPAVSGEYAIQIETDLRTDPLEYSISNETALDIDAEFESENPVICLQENTITLGVECETAGEGT